MSTLLTIVLIIVALVALLLIIALFVARDFAIEEAVIINKPRSLVFDYLKHIKNQDNFNPWSMMDPDMKKEYRGTDGTVGFVSTWESTKTKGPGQGEQEIKQVREGERLDLELRFIKPFASVSPAFFSTENTNTDQTKVTWGISGRMPYPMNLMIVGMGMNKQMGRELQNGLQTLKKVLED